MDVNHYTAFVATLTLATTIGIPVVISCIKKLREKKCKSHLTRIYNNTKAGHLPGILEVAKVRRIDRKWVHQGTRLGLLEPCEAPKSGVMGPTAPGPGCYRIIFDA